MIRIVCAAVIAALSVGAAGHAQILRDRIAVGAGLGTTGVALEVSGKVSRYVTVRGGLDYLSFGIDETYDDVEYDADFDFTTGGAFVDVHPFANGFFVSGGAYFGPKDVSATADPTTDVEIGDVTFTPDQVGSLVFDAELEDAAPFLGIGYDNTFTRRSRFGVKFVAGAIYTGEADVTLESVGGLLSDDPTLQAEIAAEEQNIEDDLEDFQLYPVLQVGLTARF